MNNNEDVTIENVVERLRIAKNEWEEMKTKGKEFREQDLLDSCPNELTANFLFNEQLKQRAIRNILKNRQRESAFRHMTKHIGQGRKRGLIQVHEIDANNQIVKTHVGKEAIEESVMNYNRNHYSKAKNALVC